MSNFATFLQAYRMADLVIRPSSRRRTTGPRLGQARYAQRSARASIHACFYARRALELAVLLRPAWLYTHDKTFKLPYQDNLNALIYEPSFRTGVGDALFTKARLIKDLGNQAVHSTKKVASTDALSATRELFHFGYWLARTYGRSGRPEPG
jgi:type I restriction enzyme R subunit